MRAEEMTLRLHDLPEGPMRDRVMRLMSAVLDFSVSCKCYEVQGDGVPGDAPAPVDRNPSRALKALSCTRIWLTFHTPLAANCGT